MARPAGDGRLAGTLMTSSVSADTLSQSNSPSWALSGAGSTVSSGQLERSASKPPGMVPEVQLMLKNELELIRAQLCAQTKGFEALSHSITLLEQESHRQQGRIARLEEEVKFGPCSSRGTTLEGLMQKRMQELWQAMVEEVQGLRGSLAQKESSVENLSQEVLESKKFLWEELEAVQAELRRVHQKLKDQDVDITRNMVRLKKVRESQVKCIKFLAQLKGRVSGDASQAVESETRSQEGNEDIWSPPSGTLGHSPPSGSIWTEERKPLRGKNRGGHHGRKGSTSTSYLSDSALQ